jgi:hypothetical protein
MLPLCVTEGTILYDESRSKTIANLIGTTSPSGKYDCVVDRLIHQASSPIAVPAGKCNDKV